MSKTLAIYLVHHTNLNREKCSWRREYFRFTAKGRLSSVSETEDNILQYTIYPKLWLPAGSVLSTKAEYQAARARYRQDVTKRKRLAELEKQRKAEMQEGMDIARGFLPPRIAPKPRLVVEVSEPAALFDEFVIVDTEYQHDVLLEVAAQRYRDWQPVGPPFVSYVQYAGWVAPAVTQLTGITEEHVREAPPEKQVLQAFLQYVQGALLIAHNIGADRSKLEAARKRQGATAELPNRWFCTLQLARARLPKGTKCGLGELVERFGFSRRGHHQALTDVQMCFQVLRHFHEQEPLRSLDPKARTAAPSLFSAA